MISVVVPVYNGESVIRQCIYSLLKQTYSAFEIIVIDDGSTDATTDVILSISDPRIRLIHQENAGVSAARNRGIEESKGDYIVFIDSDDYVDPEYLQVLRSMYRDGALSTIAFMKNCDGIPVHPDYINSRYEIGCDMPNDFLVGNLGKTIAFSCWNKLFSKHILNNNHLRFSNDLSLGEDLVFVFRYLCYCRTVVYSEKALYHYCDNLDSSIRKSKDQSLDYEKTLSALENLCENGYLFDKKTLGSWCLEIMTYILQNPYVTSMDFQPFSVHVQKVKTYRIGILACQSSVPNKFKLKIFRLALRCRSNRWLFWIIRLNNRSKQR